MEPPESEGGPAEDKELSEREEGMWPQEGQQRSRKMTEEVQEREQAQNEDAEEEECALKDQIGYICRFIKNVWLKFDRL